MEVKKMFSRLKLMSLLFWVHGLVATMNHCFASSQLQQIQDIRQEGVNNFNSVIIRCFNNLDVQRIKNVNNNNNMNNNNNNSMNNNNNNNNSMNNNNNNNNSMNNNNNMKNIKIKKTKKVMKNIKIKKTKKVRDTCELSAFDIMLADKSYEKKVVNWFETENMKRNFNIRNDISVIQRDVNENTLNSNDDDEDDE